MAEKGNRTIELVRLLSQKEKKAFAQQLEGGKRNSLPFLFNGICAALKSKRGSEPTKELLFRLTFDEPYSKDKDYLLRNEFRLLSKELSTFLSFEQVKKNFRDNSLEEKFAFLQSLIDRKAINLFEREWEKIANDAEDQLEFRISSEVRKMAILQWIENHQATIEKYERLLEMLEGFQKSLNRYFQHQFLFGKHRQAFTERTLQALGSPIEISPLEPIHFHPTEDKENDAYANHLIALTDSYRYKGNGKIEILKKAADFASQIQAKSFDQNGALASINAGIALEYFLLRELEASLPYHQKALEYGSKLENGKLISFVFNYLSTLIRLERHEQAIELINEYAAVWQKLPRMRDRFLCLKSMCHVFENNPTAAESCIPEDRKAGGLDHYYYYRFIQIIVLFQKGKPELAMNEAENFEHTVRYNDKDEDYLRLIQTMKKFLALKSEQAVIDKEAFSEKAEKLKQSLSEASESAFADRALLYRWILQNL